MESPKLYRQMYSMYTDVKYWIARFLHSNCTVFICMWIEYIHSCAWRLPSVLSEYVEESMYRSAFWIKDPTMRRRVRRLEITGKLTYILGRKEKGNISLGYTHTVILLAMTKTATRWLFPSFAYFYRLLKNSTFSPPKKLFLLYCTVCNIHTCTMGTLLTTTPRVLT